VPEVQKEADQMSNIVPLGGNPLAAREVRRATSLVKGKTSVRATIIEAETYLTALGIQALTTVGVMEEEAIKRAPLVEARVKVLADVHAGAVASELMKPW
jgi:predicted TIM-barrel enzyme